ncbi:MAG: ECF transporter S component [Clostridia bacterium]|nr:ECF transporter S component [Clostridia bacterium]
MKAANKNRIQNLTTLAMLAALAVVIGLFKFPIFPNVSFLEFDFADLPVLISTLLFGPVSGLGVLFIVSVIQAFLLGGNGVIGLIMHFIASGAVVLLFGLICRKKKSVSRLSLSAVLGTLAITALMIPLNYIFIPILFHVPTQMVTDFLPYIIAFNLIKAGVNTALACIMWVPVNKLYTGLSNKK